MVNVEDFVSVRQKAQALGCVVQDGLILLPRNFESASQMSDLLIDGSESTVRKLFRQAGIPESRLVSEDIPLRSVVQKSADFVAPIIFVSASLYSQNPELVAVALGILANYATDMFKGMSRKPEAKFTVVVERKHDDILSKKVTYEGPAEGYSELIKLVREVFKNG